MPLLFALALAGCGSDSTGPIDEEPRPEGPPPADLTLELQPFLSAGLSSPVFITQPLDDGRMFVVMQSGRIEVVRNGVLQTTSFLDIRNRVVSGGERGMFSVAFHPQYASNRLFYVYYTGANGEVRIERFTTTSNPEVADPASGKLIIGIPHAQFSNHNGGMVTFGPDGMLWFAPGDGGGQGDPLGNGQNYNALLGSMMRIDVDGGDPYAIPPSNPFVGDANRRGEIWAKGLRNPWRFAFDTQSSQLYIADVGQGSREEINVVPYATGGVNFGWNVMEGTACYPAGTPSCSQTGFTLPVFDYTHAATGGCSVTGGYVYRGTAIPELRGHYFYSDYCGSWLRSFRFAGGTVQDQKDWAINAGERVRSFGRDFAGELYVVGLNTIWKIVEGT